MYRADADSHYRTFDNATYYQEVEDMTREILDASTPRYCVFFGLKSSEWHTQSGERMSLEQRIIRVGRFARQLSEVHAVMYHSDDIYSVLEFKYPLEVTSGFIHAKAVDLKPFASPTVKGIARAVMNRFEHPSDEQFERLHTGLKAGIVEIRAKRLGSSE